MFKKMERLSRTEFDAVFKSGKRHHFPELTIITFPANTRKVAVVVGKKVSKLAVRRNNIKRRIYAAMYRFMLIKPYEGAMVVIVKPTYNQNSRKVADAIITKSIAQVIKTT